MKQIRILIALIAIAVGAQAQNYKQGLGMHIMGHDYYGPQSGKYFFNSVKSIADTTDVKKKLLWDPAIRFSYWKNMSKNIDMQLGVEASSLQMPTKKKDTLYMNSKLGKLGKSEFGYFALGGRFNYNFVSKEDYFISPYVTAGADVCFNRTNTMLNVPVGLGLNFKLGQGVFFNLESTYKIPLSSTKDFAHLTHSAGFVFWWGGDKTPKVKTPKVEVPVVVAIKDMDNDGIADADDACPDVAGRKEMNGCPDTDGDGIADKNDNCPTIAGTKLLNGCPDSDGDGIADNVDNCPSVAGISKYGGCPIPDNDNDGFNNEVDRCPDTYSATNGGCPEIAQDVIKKIETAAKGINFESGKAVILKKSYANLDKIVAIMKGDATLTTDISGHTDNSGKADKNLLLSQQRADACKNYLIAKGIDASRITSTGYGDTMPIADNSTAAGKAQNRRTEFKLKN